MTEQNKLLETVKKLVSNIVSDVDYDIWKEGYNEETAEDPEQVEGNIDGLVNRVYDELGEVFEKAEMLDALLNQQRIRVLGTAGLGEEKYQHIGLEMWTRHLGCEGDNVKQETVFGRSVLIKYLRTHASAIRNRAIEPLKL